MSPFILGYKTQGLNFIKVYRDGNNFIYPKHIPFFGFNLNPCMSIYENRIKCAKKLKFYNFRILIPSDTNYVKDMIQIYDDKKIIKVIEKDYFFSNYNYNLQTHICNKKINYFYAVKMQGIFLCKDSTPVGYIEGYKGDYLVKKENKFYIEKNNNFFNNYDIYPVIKTEPKMNKRRREDDTNEVFLNNKKQIIEKERNYYKFIDRIQGSQVSNLHTTLKTIKLFYPEVEYKNSQVYIEDYNFIIKVDKDIFPKVEIYDKLIKENKNLVITDFITNIGGYYDYYLSWYYYLVSIPKFISNSIS